MEGRGTVDTCLNKQYRNLDLQYQKKPNWNQQGHATHVLIPSHLIFCVNKGEMGVLHSCFPYIGQKVLTNLCFTEFHMGRCGIGVITVTYYQGPKALYYFPICALKNRSKPKNTRKAPWLF